MADVEILAKVVTRDFGVRDLVRAEYSPREFRPATLSIEFEAVSGSWQLNEVALSGWGEKKDGTRSKLGGRRHWTRWSDNSHPIVERVPDWVVPLIDEALAQVRAETPQATS